MIFIDELVEIENQSDGTWAGPYKVIDHGRLNDFISGGTVEILYLEPPVKHPDPNFIDFPIKHLLARRAERRSDGLLAFTYPEIWCRHYQGPEVDHD